MEMRPETLKGAGHNNGLINQVIKFEIGPDSNGICGRVLLGTVTDGFGLQKGLPV